MPCGKFYGIGVGPGDPELLTLKAKRVLEQIDLLFVPRSQSEKRSLALTIAGGAVNKEWRCIDLILPMTRDQKELSRHWQAAAQKAVEALQCGQDGAFITLGDPTLYSTFTYLLKQVKQLAPAIEVEIIPGISAVTGITAWIQEALVEGDESLLIIPAEGKQEHLESYLEQFENIMILKAGRYTQRVADLLKVRPEGVKAFLASRCGFSDEYYTSDIESLQGKQLDYLSSILIKKNKGSEVD